MNSKYSRDLIKQIALEEGLTIEEVKSIVSSPFHVVAESMKNVQDHEFPTIYVMKLGTFRVTEYAKQYWINKNKKNGNNKSKDNG